MLKHRTVGDVMTAQVVTVAPHTAFKDIAILFAQHHISAVPVIDEQRHVLGIVSETDLLSKESELAEPGGHWQLPGTRLHRLRAKAGMTRAQDLMSTPARTVGPDETIPSAARLLQQHGINRMPVVDADGVLIGIVSRHDLLSLFVRSDHDIATDVRQQVIAGALQAETNAISADVTDGVVVLNGRLDRKSLVPMTIALTRRVEGVVDVISHLTYAIDDSPSVPGSPVTADALHGLLRPH